MKIDFKKLNGIELIEELNKLIGKSVNLSFGNFGGLTVSGVLEESEQRMDLIHGYKLNGATLNIFEEAQYELRIDDSYVCIGFSYFVFIREV